VFCYVTPCSLVEVGEIFEGTYCLHLQGRRVSQEESSTEQSYVCCLLFLAVCCLLRLLFDPEDGNSKFLRNLGKPFTLLYSATPEKTVVFIVTAVKTSNPIFVILRAKFCVFSRKCHVGLNVTVRRFCRSSSPARDKNFLFSMSSRLALGSTQPPIQ
jgi:hypothetical protein